MMQILKAHVLQIFYLPFNKAYFNIRILLIFTIWSLNMQGAVQFAIETTDFNRAFPK